MTKITIKIKKNSLPERDNGSEITSQVTSGRVDPSSSGDGIGGLIDLDVYVWW